MRITDDRLKNAVQLVKYDNYNALIPILNSRTVSVIGNHIPIVYAKRSDANNRNEYCLQQPFTTTTNFIYQSCIVENENIPHHLIDDFRLHHTFRFSVGCRVMLLANISVLRGLVNGAIGIIHSVELHPLFQSQ